MIVAPGMKPVPFTVIEVELVAPIDGGEMLTTDGAVPGVVVPVTVGISVAVAVGPSGVDVGANVGVGSDGVGLAGAVVAVGPPGVSVGSTGWPAAGVGAIPGSPMADISRPRKIRALTTRI
jgi:hypothetical protein